MEAIQSYLPILITTAIVLFVIVSSIYSARSFRASFGGRAEYDSKDLSPWQQSLQDLKARQLKALPFDDRMMHSLWKWENAGTRAHVAEMLQGLAPHFGGAQVLERPDDGHIDLRGTHGGAPIRFAVWMSFGSFWGIELQAAGNIDDVTIERDHSKAPTQQNDDAWSDGEDQRHFFADGIFIEGDREEIAQMSRQLQTLPMDLQQRLIADMERLDLKSVRIDSDSVWLSTNATLHSLKEPGEYLMECANLMGAIKGVAA